MSSQKSRQPKQQPHWQRKQESFANVDPGRLITCVACKVPRYPKRFSKKQMSEYQEQLASARRGGPPAELPRCVECTPQSIKKLFCTGCLVWKDLNSFSGQQRKKPDDAKCWHCLQEILDREPTLEAAMAEEKIRDERQRATDSSSVHPSMSGSNAGSRIYTQTQSVSADGIYISDGRSNWGVSKSARPPSPTNTEASFSHSTSTYTGAASRNSFAKQGAYRTPIEAKVTTQMAREALQREEAQMASKRDESDDDDDEWEL